MSGQKTTSSAIGILCVAVALHAGQLHAATPNGVFENVECEGTYPGHLQGICTDNHRFIFWSFTTTLVKTDRKGKLVKKTPVASHHGDLCWVAGKLYVAVNLGPFNDPRGRADSWVFVYDANTLEELVRHKTPELIHGAGGIGCDGRHFLVVGGLPPGVNENRVFEYDENFKLVAPHVVRAGYTFKGIQTAAFAGDHWWFGCYGNPRVLLKTNKEYDLVGKYPVDCAYGLVGLPDGRFLAASGAKKGSRHTGQAIVADADAKRGLVPRAEQRKTGIETEPKERATWTRDASGGVAPVGKG